MSTWASSNASEMPLEALRLRSSHRSRHRSWSALFQRGGSSGHSTLSGTGFHHFRREHTYIAQKRRRKRKTNVTVNSQLRVVSCVVCLDVGSTTGINGGYGVCGGAGGSAGGDGGGGVGAMPGGQGGGEGGGGLGGGEGGGLGGGIGGGEGGGGEIGGGKGGGEGGGEGGGGCGAMPGGEGGGEGGGGEGGALGSASTTWSWSVSM